MNTWFTADTHFGHAAGRAFYRRPFASVRDMDEAMVVRWNEVVAEDDEVFHLGDFAVRHPDPSSVLARLRGRKTLITGNNDPPPVCALAGWEAVHSFLEIERDGRLLVLCHYALRSWRDMARGALNLHGHSHGRLAPITRQFDVGVDVRDFIPVTVPDLLARPKRSETGRA